MVSIFVVILNENKKPGRAYGFYERFHVDLVRESASVHAALNETPIVSAGKLGTRSLDEAAIVSFERQRRNCAVRIFETRFKKTWPKTAIFYQGQWQHGGFSVRGGPGKGERGAVEVYRKRKREKEQPDSLPLASPEPDFEVPPCKQQQQAVITYLLLLY